MSKIHIRKITDIVVELCIQANTVLRKDVRSALLAALKNEENLRAVRILKALLANADYARKLKLAICQDTGLPYVFVELGQEARIYAGNLIPAINKAVEQGYKRGRLRNSVILHPLKRRLPPRYGPAVIHIDLVKGKHIRLTLMPKGFGSENKSQAKMFNPSAKIEEIKSFIIEKVKQAGADACPPFIIGVGIGGGFDQAALLAKKALLRPIDKRNPDGFLANLEDELLKAINQLGIGPMGLGGRTTALGVNILTCPTHIAGLAVAVNISCHALRSATKTL